MNARLFLYVNGSFTGTLLMLLGFCIGLRSVGKLPVILSLAATGRCGLFRPWLVVAVLSSVSDTLFILFFGSGSYLDVD